MTLRRVTNLELSKTWEWWSCRFPQYCEQMEELLVSYWMYLVQMMLGRHAHNQIISTHT